MTNTPITIKRDTIYAFATAPGKAGVAILRISGAESLGVLKLLGVDASPAPRQAALTTLKHPETHDVIDRALCLYFPAPHSFTGEDVLELHLHGSLAIKNALLDVLSANKSYRLAEPGEFTRRAFINDKMDLTESEGLVDVIEAQTSSQLNQAMRQMSGAHKKHFEGLRAKTIEALALLEAYIDFPDEDIPESLIRKINDMVDGLKASVSALLENSEIGERIRSGFEIVLIGAPNAGKSSLLNSLSGRDVAIVHETPGTTRDMVEVQLDLGGYAVTLVDTAGLRESDNAIEAEGIRRAKARAEHAQLILHLIDITDTEQISNSKEDKAKNILSIYTKNDLSPALKIDENALSISTKTSDGLDALLRQLKDRVEVAMHSHTPVMITRARHREHLQLAHGALARFDLNRPLELACEELRFAANQIGNITGKIATDDLLDVIFKELCIGK